MKTTVYDILKLNPCASGAHRLSKQLNVDGVQAINKTFEVADLVGGCNTIGDILWLMGKKGHIEQVVEFATFCTESFRQWVTKAKGKSKWLSLNVEHVNALLAHTVQLSRVVLRESDPSVRCFPEQRLVVDCAAEIDYEVAVSMAFITEDAYCKRPEAFHAPGGHSDEEAIRANTLLIDINQKLIDILNGID